MFNFFAIRRNSVCQFIEGLGGFLLYDYIVTVESSLSRRNLGVSYTLLCLRDVDAEVKSDLFCYWTVISIFSYFAVYSSLLNQDIFFSNDLCICEGVVFTSVICTPF